MAAGPPIWILVAVFAAVAVIAIPVVVAINARRQRERIGPRCGNCGYNLTGAPSNRCPECGMLFIEAGIVTAQQAEPPPRRATGTMLLLAVGLTLFAVLGVIFMEVSTSAARARAVAAQQAAAAQRQAQATAQRASTTAPAAETHGEGESPESP
jgi:hypothetical protein